MSLPPHRELDAKVEGRDPLEPVKETMTPFKALMTRILRVPMSEVREQQELYADRRSAQAVSNASKKTDRSADKLAALTHGSIEKILHKEQEKK